jgi:hypothetical protein
MEREIEKSERASKVCKTEEGKSGDRPRGCGTCERSRPKDGPKNNGAKGRLTYRDNRVVSRRQTDRRRVT